MAVFSSVVLFDQHVTNKSDFVDALPARLDDNDLVLKVTSADCIIINGNANFTHDICEKIRPLISSNTIVSEMCSAKEKAHKLLSPYLDNQPQFLSIGLLCHDIIALCPTQNTDLKTIEKISQYWEEKSYHIEIISPKDHDEIVALNTQLSIVQSIAVLDCLNEFPPHIKEHYLRLSRAMPLSELDSSLEPLIDNKEALSDALEELVNKITALRKAIKREDKHYLQDVTTRASKLNELAKKI